MTRFALRHSLLPLTVLVVAFYLLDGLGLDFLFSDPFYQGTQLGWIYKHSWWANELIHRGGRTLIIGMSATCLLIVIHSLTSASALRSYRRAALYLLLCIGLSTGTAAMGKTLTHRHCPKQYQRYGGSVPYTPILSLNHAPAAPGIPTGRCFPAGHASGGFALVALYFVFYRNSRKLAYVGLACGLLLGSIFTFGQLVRGAHFISHSVATLALCWIISLLLSPLVLETSPVEPVKPS